MILLRTERVDAQLEAFAKSLEELSGLPTLFLVDERRGAVDAMGRRKISITQKACEDIGLYCPDDFGWRCGDYGFYLARAQYPETATIWMIENDVRIAGTDPAAFFRKFRDEKADFVASYLSPAEADWPWYKTLQARDARPFKCFFPVVRLSSHAIDLLREKRRSQARRWNRRWLWPNDEGFVATTLVNAGIACMDLNNGEPSVYRPDEFSFAPVMDGALPIVSADPVALFHPVLEGEALMRKRERLQTRENQRWTLSRVRRRAREAVLRRLNSQVRW